MNGNNVCRTPANATPAPVDPTSTVTTPWLPPAPLDVPELEDVSLNLTPDEQEKVAAGNPNAAT